MDGCSFSKLVKFVEGQLELGPRVELLDHLDRCDICREAVYQIWHDQEGIVVNKPRIGFQNNRYLRAG
jgi:hypothetical protein